jgi:hypothetical protein
VFSCFEQIELNFSSWNCSKTNLGNTTERTALPTGPPTAPDVRDKVQHRARASNGSCKEHQTKQCYRTHGHSVGSVKHCTSAKDCCAACQKAAGCVTYSLDLTKNNTCWLLDNGARVATENYDCLSGTFGPTPPPFPGPAPSPTCTGIWGCFVGPSCTCDGRTDNQFNCL